MSVTCPTCDVLAYENERLRECLSQTQAERDQLAARSGMLSSVHGALLDAGLQMGDVGTCEADKVRELTDQIERLRECLLILHARHQPEINVLGTQTGVCQCNEPLPCPDAKILAGGKP